MPTRAEGGRPAAPWFGTGTLATLILLGLAAGPAGAQAQLQAPQVVGGTPLPESGGERLSPRGFSLNVGTDARLVSTSNPGPDAQGRLQRDTVLEVQPWLTTRLVGPRLRADGRLYLSLIEYANGTQPARVLPRAHLNAEAELIEKLGYLSALYRVDPTFEDPFASRPDQSVSYKLEPRERLNVAPELRRQMGPLDSLSLRSDNSWTRLKLRDTGTVLSSSGRDTQFRYQHRAQPAGIDLEARRVESWSGSVDDRVYLSQLARAGLSYALTPRLEVGATVGRERVDVLGIANSASTHGLRLNWRPDARMRLQASVESRYFGQAWDIEAVEQSPLFYAAARLQRQPSTERAGGAVIGAGEDVAAALNAMLGSQIPDAAAREAEVARLMQARGLPAVAGQAIDVLTTLPELRQGASVTLGLRGVRNFVFVSSAYLKLEPLRPDGVTVLPLTGISSLQRVTTLGWSHRLGPLTAATLTGEGFRTLGLAERAGNFTTQKSLKLDVTRLLSPSTALSVGARRVVVRSNVLSPVDAAGETAAYVGLRHRF